MFSILIANPKGGCGKSTLATNLAGHYANAGRKVMLGDIDRQQSSLFWLSKRSTQMPGISGWQVQTNEAVKPPKNTEVIILDSPSGIHGKKLEQILERIDRVIVPVQPSPFDMDASRQFFASIQEQKRVRKGKAFVGIVGMRVDSRTKSAQELETFLGGYSLPVLTWIRDTQMYVRMACEGLTLFDLAISRSSRDRQEWQPIINWLRNGEA